MADSAVVPAPVEKPKSAKKVRDPKNWGIKDVAEIVYKTTLSAKPGKGNKAITRKTSNDVAEKLAEQQKEHLLKYGELRIPLIGTIGIQYRPPRTQFNIAEGKKGELPEGVTTSFSSGSVLRKALKKIDIKPYAAKYKKRKADKEERVAKKLRETEEKKKASEVKEPAATSEESGTPQVVSS